MPGLLSYVHTPSAINILFIQNAVIQAHPLKTAVDAVSPIIQLKVTIIFAMPVQHTILVLSELITWVQSVPKNGPDIVAYLIFNLQAASVYAPARISHGSMGALFN